MMPHYAEIDGEVRNLQRLTIGKGAKSKNVTKFLLYSRHNLGRSHTMPDVMRWPCEVWDPIVAAVIAEGDKITVIGENKRVWTGNILKKRWLTTTVVLQVVKRKEAS